MPQAPEQGWRDAAPLVGVMSGAQPLGIVARRAVPLGGYSVELTRSTCGSRAWSLRFEPESGSAMRSLSLANGFGDTAEERENLAMQLRALAVAVEDWP